MKTKLKTEIFGRIFLALALAAASVGSTWAQGDVPSGTISSSGSGPYTYNLIFSDATGATGSIGSVWYAWVPGQFFLPGTPTGASAPTGWSATISGDSIQFVASSSTFDIAPGSSLSGFSYQATFTPAALAGAANSGKADAYTGGLFSDGGQIFTVQSVPEPSTLALLGAGLALYGWHWRTRRRNARCATGTP
jgi:hypothetical protein